MGRHEEQPTTPLEALCCAANSIAIALNRDSLTMKTEVLLS